MSRYGYYNLVPGSDKSDWDLAKVKSGEDQTCPIQELDMFDKTYWNPIEDPDKSG
jgi:hypothetical protein